MKFSFLRVWYWSLFLGIMVCLLSGLNSYAAGWPYPCSDGRAVSLSVYPTTVQGLPAKVQQLSGLWNHRFFQQTDQVACAAPPNPIVAENCQPGTADWQITNYLGDIEGYASATSINLGEKIDFFVNTTAPVFSISIYRSGFYSGTGGRLVRSITDLPGQVQPDCHHDLSTGLTSCSNWSTSYSLTVPDDWVSGIYLVKLVRLDTGGENYIIFVIRDDDRDTDILFQQSVTTYQAYNPYGGKSLYSSVSPASCLTVAEAPRAVKVSFDRPYGQGLYVQNSYFWTDFPMVYWLEAQGYDIGYTTNIDTHRSGQSGQMNGLLKHRLFLSVGHDEYWTQEMRTAITAARDAGVHLGFFSSNVSYWRIRLEPDPWTKQSDRVVVGYKTTESGAADPSGQPTTTWRDRAGANNPENNLVGVQYVGDNDINYFPLRVSAKQAQDRFFRHTGLQNMPAGTYVDIGRHLIGWEWDAVTNNGGTPEGLVILTESPTYGALLADSGRTYRLGKAAAQASRYQAPSGAMVFASGTNQWAWGLALFEPDSRIQQMTYNLLSDMGLQPATPTAGLVLDNGKAVVGNVPPLLAAGTSAETAQDPVVSGVYATMTGMGAQLAPATSKSSTEPVKPVLQGTGLDIVNSQVAATENVATISWETNVPANGQVWIMSAPGFIDYRLSLQNQWLLPVVNHSTHEENKTQHEIILGGLAPNRVYSYRIASMDEQGRTTISPEISFKTEAGSIVAQAKFILKTLYHSLPCWFVGNWFLFALGSGIVFLIIAGVIGWQFRYARQARTV